MVFRGNFPHYGVKILYLPSFMLKFTLEKVRKSIVCSYNSSDTTKRMTFCFFIIKNSLFTFYV